MNLQSARTWYVGSAVAAVLMLLAGWFLLVSPAKSTAADLTDQTTVVEAQNAATQSKIAQLQAQAKGLVEQSQKLAAIQSKIPLVPALPALIRTLSASATSAGVTLVSVTPGAPTVVAGGHNLQSIALEVKVAGSFAGIRLYLNSLETMNRAYLVNAVEIAAVKDASASTNTSSASTSTTSTTTIAKGPLTADIVGNVYMSTATPAAAAS